MVSPSTRRTGFSKKAQFSVFTGYVAAGFGALLGIALLTLSFWQPSALAPLRSGANDAVAPAGEATASVRGGAYDIWSSISGYFYAGSQNAALREEVEIARIRLAEAEAIAQENERLKSLISLAESEIEPVAVGRLVGSSSTSSRRFATIGVGRTDGIEIGMPVRSARGVIGRVLEVARGSSRILLLTDSESVIPVRRSTDSTVAFAEGRGDGLLYIRLIDLGINPLEEGDLFLTSGAGGYYRPGAAVAIITEITSDGGIARLVANPAATDFVSVEPIYVPQGVLAGNVEDQIELSEEAIAQEAQRNQ